MARIGAMRVGFDGRCLESPAGGVRRYAGELIQAITRVDPTVEIVVVGAPRAAPLPSTANRQPVRRRAPTNLGWSLVDLPLALRRSRLDVFHAPAYTAPLVNAHPLVLTIHDVCYERHPEWYPYRSDSIRRRFYRRCALTADLIITDSDFSRGEVAAAYEIDPRRIKVVPLGVGPPFVGAKQGPLLEGVRQPYILHVGDLHPRRNLHLLVRALSRFVGRSGDRPVPTLVLVGADLGERNVLEQEALGCGVPCHVAGRPDDEVLASLYSGAAAFVYPSRYEGFGLPLLEAMACGTPVVAARTSAIPEVVGEAGLLVEPDGEHDLAIAVEQVLNDSPLAHRLREAGRARASRFTWDQTASLTLDTYRAAISSATAPHN